MNKINKQKHKKDCIQSIPVIRNKDIIQSYIITTAKYDFSVYEKRIIYRIVEMLQTLLQGKKLDKGFSINKDLLENRIIRLPVASLLINEEDEHYNRIKKALKSLQRKLIEYEDNKTWEAINLIAFSKIKKYSTSIEFLLHPKIYDALLNFSKGFRKYELEIAMQFRSVYAMRFYELFSGQKQPITYTVEYLKEMFQLKTKYNVITDFIKYVIIPAKTELDKIAPYSFNYQPVYEDKRSGKGRKKITAITFTPVFHSKNRDEQLETKALQKQVSPYWSLSRETISYLKNTFNFKTEELKRNMDLLKEAEQKINIKKELVSLEQKALKTDNTKGYVVNALKGMINSYQLKNNEKDIYNSFSNDIYKHCLY